MVPPTEPEPEALELVPRYKGQGYTPDDVRRRREWLERKLGVALPTIASGSVPTVDMRGNIENPIGTIQVPLGVAGPLAIHGQHARGTFYVPMATTEGALVRSYERGMALLTRAGGATARVYADGNLTCPLFLFDTVEDAHAFASQVPGLEDALRREAESTTRHGRLRHVEVQAVGRAVILLFHFHTGDAQGMNMIVNATDRAARWLVREGHAPRYELFSGRSSEKRASGALFAGGKGKKVVAGATIPAPVVHSYLRATPRQMCDVWHASVIGQAQAAALGCNAHLANGIAALFLACGQDVANVANAAVGITDFDVTASGDLAASVTLPSLTVGTVGGGTGLGSGRECLEMLGCAGTGQALKFAEIAAATALAGELSMAGAIASGEFVSAHEAYGRNRPRPSEP